MCAYPKAESTPLSFVDRCFFPFHGHTWQKKKSPLEGPKCP